MSSRKSTDPSALFLIYLVIFCFMNWGLWWHYKTMQGPTASAVVIDKQQEYSKNGYHYYLTVGFTTTRHQKATSELSVRKSSYQDFAINDAFLIKYAEDDPTEAAFVGDPFFATWAVVSYLFVASILVTSAVSRYRKSVRRQRMPRKKKRLSTPPLPAAPIYSAKRALIWTTIGVLTFSSGIVSCRHTADLDTLPLKANEYAQARLLSVQYRPEAPPATALVRLVVATADDSASSRTIRLPLTAEQHALLQAKLSRLQTPAPDVLVKYPAAAPEQATLADGQTSESASAGAGSSFLNYDTLGVVLCVLGIIIFVVNLGKYVQHSNSYD